MFFRFIHGNAYYNETPGAGYFIKKKKRFIPLTVLGAKSLRTMVQTVERASFSCIAS
jgi:hypothetical protein